MRRLLLALSFATVVCAQSVPRSPDGHLLEGIWNSASLTPLQRPAALGTKEFYTEAEAAAYEKKRVDEANRDRRDGPPEVDVGRSYNELFYDRGTKLAPNRRTSLIIDPPDGRIPTMTPQPKPGSSEMRLISRRIPPMDPRTGRCPTAA